MPDCPLPLDVLPKPLQKHADAKAPPPLRMMGAKGLVPAVAPVDLCTLLYVLSFDADAPVRDTAVKTADGLPDKIWGVALRSEGMKGPVLDWLSDRFASKEAALELVLLNAATSDETVARLAPVVSQKLADIVRQNELRLLRHDAIIRGLCQNPNALASLQATLSDTLGPQGRAAVEILVGRAVAVVVAAVAGLRGRRPRRAGTHCPSPAPASPRPCWWATP